MTIKTLDEREEKSYLDRIAFQIEQGRGNFPGWKYHQDRELVEKERGIVASPEAVRASVDDVFLDFVRIGKNESQVLASVFMLNTVEDSRKASLAGRHGKVVYLAVGDFVHGRDYFK